MNLFKKNPIRFEGQKEIETQIKNQTDNVISRRFKILMGVIAFAICCTVGLIQDMLSLISLTTFIILISQYVGILKYKIENSKNKRR